MPIKCSLIMYGDDSFDWRMVWMTGYVDAMVSTKLTRVSRWKCGRQPACFSAPFHGAVAAIAIDVAAGVGAIEQRLNTLVSATAARVTAILRSSL